jgi:major membrane immunogen (membrane-anchored lipoprotein)
MKGFLPISGVAAISFMFALSACSTQEEVARKPSPAPAPAPAPAAKAEAAPAKAKVTKTKGDVGLLDTEKNYMILVTKDGKLVTLDFDAKTKVTKLVPTPAKMADVGLGSAATVTYTKDGGKNIASGLEYKAKKGGE